MDDVLHELRPVGLQPLPFLCAADALVSDTLAAELICTKLGLHIREASAGRERNEEHPALVAELDAADLAVHVILHGIHSCPVDIPPEPHNILVRVAPSSDQRLKLVFRKAHLQGSHRFESSDRAAIAEGEFSDFAFLPQVAVHAVFFNRNLEHLRCGSAVDVAAFFKDLLTPDFTGKPRQYSGLDCREIGDDELVSRLRHKGGADQLRERIRHIFVEKLHAVKVAAADKPTSLCQIRKMVLGQVLHLDNASGPTTGPVGTVELKHSTSTTIGADCLFHRLILLDGRFGQLLPEKENLLELCRSGFEHFSDFLLSKGIHLQPVVRKPLLHLLYGVGVIQGGQFLHSSSELCTGAGVHSYGLMHQLHIEGDTSVVNFLIEVILLPDHFRHRKLGELFLNGHLDLDITDVVPFEGSPLVRSVFRQVAGSTTIGLCRRTGLAEILDELFAFGQFLLSEAQNGTDTFQRKG